MDKKENIKNDMLFVDGGMFQKCGKDAILNNKYYVDKSKKIESLSTNDYDVFEVTDISGGKKDQDLCIRILKDATLLRYEAIKKIISNPIDNFICPIDIGIIVFEDSGEEFIGIIYPKIFGVTFGELIDKKETFSEKYIIKNVVSNINEVLRILHDLDIEHGSINLDTIRLTKDGDVVLDECFLFLDIKTSPIYYTPACSVINVSSSFGEPQSDYYALGIVCLELLIGERVSGYKDDQLNAKRIYEGSYNYFLKGQIITGTIKKIIQGLLQDNKDDRFGYK
ncbi:MAG: serine/threonine protein kinase [Candidatus Midichloriaceae bacterium]|jgi:serine/threonine protein kinase